MNLRPGWIDAAKVSNSFLVPIHFENELKNRLDALPLARRFPHRHMRGDTYANRSVQIFGKGHIGKVGPFVMFGDLLQGIHPTHHWPKQRLARFALCFCLTLHASHCSRLSLHVPVCNRSAAGGW